MSRYLCVLSVAAMAIGVPAYAAQQLSATEAKQAAQGVVDAFNKAAQAKDAAAVAAMFTDDASVASPFGINAGRAAIEKNWVENFKDYAPAPNKLEQAVPAGDGAIALIGDWSGVFHGKDGDQPMKGYYGQTLVHQGGVWKIRMETWNQLKQ